MEKELNENFTDEHEGAAITLQAAFRGRQERKHLETQRSEETTKSTKRTDFMVKIR